MSREHVRISAIDQRIHLYIIDFDAKKFLKTDSNSGLDLKDLSFKFMFKW